MISTPVQGSLNATTDAPISIPTGQCRSLGIKITGSFSGTLAFQGTSDGTNWDAAPAITVAASPSTVTSTTAAGIWQMNCSEFQQVRINPTAFTPGTPAVVTLSPSVAPMRRNTAPITPTGLAAAGGTGQTVLTWTNPGGVTSWDVEISSDGGSTWGSPINVLVATYTDASATSNVQASTGQVCYRIRANNAGGSSPFTDGAAHASPWILYDTFTGVDGTAITSHSPNLAPGGSSWSAVAGTWQIQSNTLQDTTHTDSERTSIESGQSEVTASMDVAPQFTDATHYELPSICIRGNGAHSYWMLQLGNSSGNNTSNLALYEVTNGSYVQRASASVTITYGQIYTITLKGLGTALTGTSIAGGSVSFTSSSFQANTKIGTRIGGNGANATTLPTTWDILKVTSP